MEIYFDPKVQAFLRYLDFPGDEPVVVFLAGLGLASTAAFPRIVIEPGLSERRSILVDLFGSGFSDRPTRFGYSIEEHASTLSGFLDHINSKQFVLMGHSMGGAVAIELASKRPDLVMQIILAEANLEAGGGILSRNIAKQSESDFVRRGYQELINGRRSAALGGDSISSIALGMWQVASPLAIHRGAASLVKGTSPVMLEKLIQLSIPRTFVFGSRSLEEYEEDREMYKRLESHRIHMAVVPDTGHAMMAENAVGFARVLGESLASYAL